MSSNRRRSARRSLRFRLTLTYALVFAACLLAVFVILFLLVQRGMVRQADAAITAEARRMLDLAARRKAKIMQAEIDRLVRHHGADAVFVSLYARDGGLLAQSDSAGWDDAPPAALPAPRGRPETLPGGRTRAITMQGAAGHIVHIRLRLLAFDRLLHASAAVLAAAFAASLGIGTVLAYLATRQAVVRIDRVRRAAAAIAAGDLSQRVPASGGGGDEVAALIRTFNAMIERIESAVHELRAVTDSVAHDFRTPLTRMRGTVEALLLKENVSGDALEALTVVVEECDSLERMIGTMLQIVRLDGGAQVPAPERVSIRELVERAVELLAPAFEDKGVALRVTAIPEGLCANANRPLTERVLANLLDNALKFTPRGGEVSVDTARDGARAVLAVSDTGIGVDAADLPRIFERFYRAERSRPAAGAGLGLSFVLSAVRSQGGSIDVRSAPGEGSVFMVSLPAA